MPQVRKPLDTGGNTQAQHSITTVIMTPQALGLFSTRAGATSHVRRHQIVARFGSKSIPTGGYLWLTYLDSCTHERLISPNLVEFLLGLAPISGHPSH